MLPQAAHDPGSVLRGGFPDDLQILLTNIRLPVPEHFFNHSIVHGHAEFTK